MEEWESLSVQKRTEKRKTVYSLRTQREGGEERMKGKSKSRIDRIGQLLGFQSTAVSHDTAVTAETFNTQSSEVTRPLWLSSLCVLALGCRVSVKCQRRLKKAGEEKKNQCSLETLLAPLLCFQCARVQTHRVKKKRDTRLF